MNKTMKRALSFLLCLVMVIGILPTSIMKVSAAENDKTVEDAAIIFSDLHTNSGNYKDSNIKAIMTAFKDTGLPFSTVTSAGDAFSVNEDSTKYTGYTSTITSSIRNGLGNATIPVNYVWSDHDRYAVKEDGTTLLDKTSKLIYGAGSDGIYGNADDDNYYIYSLSMGDLCSYDRYNAGFNYTEKSNNRASKGFTATVPEAIANFENAVAGLKKDRPLLIVSHQPLFDNRNDNAWAEDWFDAINEVALTMDVAFFYGHNHKYDTGSDYYYAKGSTMPVATQTLVNGSSWNYDYEVSSGWKPSNDLASENKVLNFTHMCAGYMEPSSTQSTSNTTRQGTAIGVTIYEDSIRYATYNSNGVYTGKYALDVTVDREFAVIEEPETPVVPDEPEDVIVPEGYTLARVEVVNRGADKYYLGDTLDTSALSVEAVYTMADADDVRTPINAATEENADGYTISGFDASKAGKQYVSVTYQGCVGNFVVEVFQKIFTNEAGDVTVEFTNYGITSMKATSQVKTEEGYSAYVVYDITPTGYTQGDQATVTVEVDTDLFDTTRSVMVLDQGKVIAITDIEDGKVTFTTNHFSKYDVVQTDASQLPTNWVEVPAVDKTIFRLTDRLDGNKKYVIVNTNSAGAGDAYAVRLNGTSIATQKVEVIQSTEGNYIEAPSTAEQWTYSNNRFYIGTTNYLRGNNSTPSTTTNSDSTGTSWTYNKDTGLSTTFRSSYWNTTRYLYYNNGSFATSTDSDDGRVYLYVEENIKTDAYYVGAAGKTTFDIAANAYADQAAVEAMIRQYLKFYKATNAQGTGAQAVDYTMTWTDTLDPAAQGSYKMVASNGDIEVDVTVNVIVKGVKKVELSSQTGSVERGSTTAAETGAHLTVTYEDDTTEVVPVTVAMLNGSYNLNKNDSYRDLTLKYLGQTVTSTFTLVVTNVSGDDFPDYPNPGSVDLSKTATGVDFQNTGIARVELSTSGLPYNKGIDVIVMLDTSSSMTRCIYCSVKSGSHNNANCPEGEYRSRLAELNDALDDMIDTFAAKNPDGTDQDIRIAIRDFNGAVSGATARDSNDRTQDVGGLTGNASLTEFTGSGLGADAFVRVADNYTALKAINVTKTASGTNYDYAFDAIYRMGQAITEENEKAGVERDLFVLFMSDGAPNYYNYYGSQGGEKATDGSDDWNYWLTGAVGKSVSVVSTDGTVKVFDGDELELSDIVQNSSHYHYFDEETGNQHRMANAVKGDPNTRYEIIRKATTDMNGLESTGETNMYTIPGLGATVYSVAFTPANDGKIQKEAMLHVLRNVATTQDKHYYEATESGALTEAFTTIASDIKMAATNARYVDQLGSSYNLQMDPEILTTAEGLGGKTTTNTDIVITTHPVYTESQLGTNVDGHMVTSEDIGKPYGTGTPVETVSFDVVDGKLVATTNVGGYTIPNGSGGTTKVEANTTNILVGDVIYAKNFYYNNNTNAVTIGTMELAAETFQWNIGTINEKQYTMSYTVYLDGSMDGHASAGSYETNNFAILYYTNHLGNEVYQSVPSPSMAWKGAQVSYGFYLVNDQGQPVYADGTIAPNFLTAHKVTQPVLYKSVELNKTEATVLDAAALAVLPEGYELYAPQASYSVTIDSGDGEGEVPSGWTITNDADRTTYVMGYGAANDYTNLQSVVATADEYKNYEFTNTTVYFAVKWVIGAVPDTVVIDFGLPVDVNVLANDMFGANGTLAGVGLASDKPTTRTSNDVFAGNTIGNAKGVAGVFGTATVNNDKIRYTLNKSNGMQMSEAEQLAYSVDYNGANAGFYYGNLTVIPATTIYYEDQFVTLKTYTREDTTTTEYNMEPGWPTDSKIINQAQGEDRPGYFNLGTIDANNIYGYDSVYAGMSTHSMDSAAMIRVNAKQYGTAEFSFRGTGFDVVAVTSNNTGVMLMEVTGPNGYTLSRAVDTYYGYTYGLFNVVYKMENGLWTKSSVGDAATGAEQTKDDLPKNAKEGDTATIVHYTWKPVTNEPNALYQIPVIKLDGLAYGTYNVKLTALYYSVLDHNSDSGYDLYLDAIRIYDPAGTTSDELGTIIENAYAADGELFPSYFELRNKILSKDNAEGLKDGDTTDGIVFIDGNKVLDDGNAVTGAALTDYQNYGPNNELYLASGQSIAFNLSVARRNGYTPVVRIGMKNVGNKNAVAELWNVSSNGDKLNTISQTLKTATDMYYDITVLNNGNVVIRNNGEAGSVLSITTIKTSYKPVQVTESGAVIENPVMLSVTRESLNAALLSLTPPAADVTPDVDPVLPEVDPTEPEVDPTEPEVDPTEPEVKPTEPEVKPTEPEVKPTEPEVKPTEPKVEPTEPEAKPVKPETRPTEPAKPEIKPDKAEVKPEEPENKPAEPETEIDDPETETDEVEDQIVDTEEETQKIGLGQRILNVIKAFIGWFAKIFRR